MEVNMSNQSKDILIKLLSGPAHCDEFGCTTCGGRRGLEMDFVRGSGISIFSEEFFNQLKELEAGDLHCIEFDIEQYKTLAIDSVLNVMKDDRFHELYKHYSLLSATDDELAYKLLVWTRFGKRLTQNQLEMLIQYAMPTLLRSYYARNLMKTELSYKDLSYPKELKDIYSEDSSKERDRLHEIWQAEKRKKEEYGRYILGLKELTFPDYLDVLLTKKIDPRYWDSLRCEISDDELNNLNLVEIQELINKCMDHSEQFWLTTIDRLCDKRNTLRIEAMNSLREKYLNNTNEETLCLLLNNASIPIEHYPYELAAFISREWFESLVNTDKIRFVKMLEKTRLKKWRRLLKKNYITMEEIN